MKPKRIILIRHGESIGNTNKEIYNSVPDYALELTEKGHEQALNAGVELKKLVGDSKMAIYVSPMWRTRMTFEGIAKSFNKNQINYKEDPRLREQEWGHLRGIEENMKFNKEREDYGIFYYRFHHGESGADVYDRMSGFLSTLYRDFQKVDFPDNVVLVTHGLSIRLFIMRWFHLTVEEFEELNNPKNCQIIIMEKQENNKYKLIEGLSKSEAKHKYQRPVQF
ncbi:MAG: histidine phosphatase family protein [Bacteroidota bacterium]|nr:histidine phosphatase family protein [Bacteroidota bacterium]